MVSIPQPRLSWLNLNINKITSFADFGGHDEIVTLLLAENRLQNCAGISALPKLQELNLSGNKINTVADLQGLGALKKLDLSKNKLQDLKDFPCMPALETLDLQENAIEKDGEAALMCLTEQESLRTLLMQGNAWVDDKGDEFKKEVLIALDMLSIKQINDMEEVNDEDLQDAKETKIQREKDRLEAEEEARRLAEEAKNNPEGEEAE